MFKFPNPWRDLREARRQIDVLKKLVEDLQAARSADTERMTYLYGRVQTMTADRARDLDTIERLMAQSYDVSDWIGQICEAGTADDNGVPLADESQCEIIAFPTRTLQ